MCLIQSLTPDPLQTHPPFCAPTSPRASRGDVSLSETQRIPFRWEMSSYWHEPAWGNKEDESQTAGHLVASNTNREPPHYSAVCVLAFCGGSFDTQDLLTPGFLFSLLMKSEVTQWTTIKCLVKYMIFVKQEIMCGNWNCLRIRSRCNNIKMLDKLTKTLFNYFSMYFIIYCVHLTWLKPRLSFFMFFFVNASDNRAAHKNTQSECSWKKLVCWLVPRRGVLVGSCNTAIPGWHSSHFTGGVF